MIARPHAFFLPASLGQRFCLYYETTAAMPRGAVLYIHPYAEEMNKSRRMAAEQARHLARAGWDVLAIDLYGCGDSDGESSQASWTLWQQDIACAWRWLDRRLPSRRWLWGARLGALLASDFAQTCAPNPQGLLLWQPVINGEQHLNQFLRLRTVQAIMRPGPSGANAQTLKQTLESGEAVEIAGYGLSPALAREWATRDLGRMTPRVDHVRWLEVSSAETPSISPAATRIAEAWSAQGVDTRLTTVRGPAFWQTQEIEIAPNLWDLTTDSLEALS